MLRDISNVRAALLPTRQGVKIKQGGATYLLADQSHRFPQTFLEAGGDDWSCWAAACTSQEEMAADTRSGAAKLTGS